MLKIKAGKPLIIEIDPSLIQNILLKFNLASEHKVVILRKVQGTERREKGTN